MQLENTCNANYCRNRGILTGLRGVRYPNGEVSLQARPNPPSETLETRQQKSQKETESEPTR